MRLRIRHDSFFFSFHHTWYFSSTYPRSTQCISIQKSNSNPIHHHIIRNSPTFHPKFSALIQANLQNVLIVGSKNILLDRSCNSLQRLVGLALGIVVLHIVERSERRLDGDVISLVTRIVEGYTHGSGDNVWLSVLLRKRAGD